MLAQKLCLELCAYLNPQSGRSNKELHQMLILGLTPASSPLFCARILAGAECLLCHSFTMIFKDLFSCICLHLYPHACGYLLSLLCPHHCPTQPICGFPLPISWSLTRLMWLMKLHASLVMFLSVPFMYKDASTGPNPKGESLSARRYPVLLALVYFTVVLWSQASPTLPFWAFPALCRHPCHCLPNWNRTKSSLSVNARYQGE